MIDKLFHTKKNSAYQAKYSKFCQAEIENVKAEVIRSYVHSSDYSDYFLYSIFCKMKTVFIEYGKLLNLKKLWITRSDY